MPDLEAYWDVLQAAVCRKCIDGNGTGACLVSGGECAVKKYLPQILDVVDTTSSTSIDAYEAQLRLKVCGQCRHQSPYGACSLRNHVECALDRYFPLIVQLVEEVQGRGGTRNAL